MTTQHQELTGTCVKCGKPCYGWADFCVTCYYAKKARATGNPASFYLNKAVGTFYKLRQRGATIPQAINQAARMEGVESKALSYRLKGKNIEHATRTGTGLFKLE